MSHQQPRRSPLARLVLFIIGLSIAGSILAGVHWFAVDLPAEQYLQAPQNSNAPECKVPYYQCIRNCQQNPADNFGVCRNRCRCFADACKLPDPVMSQNLIQECKRMYQ
jgi:hypothetical protein